VRISPVSPIDGCSIDRVLANSRRAMPICNCKPPIAPKVLHPRKSLLGWIVPSAVIVLLPKCPLCFAAYAAWFGVCLSASNATIVRDGLAVVSVTVLAWMVVRVVRRTWSR
jgi:hypothetical protein